MIKSSTKVESLPVHVTGCSCLLAASLHPKALSSGTNALTPIPVERWNDVPTGAAAARFGAFVTVADVFDAPLFALSPAEAKVIDPQQRHVLEHSYCTLHSSQHRRHSCNGSDIGIFVGVWTTEYASVISSQPWSVYDSVACHLSVFAGRVSFTFGMRGPCVSIDTACSSSLVACNAAIGTLSELTADFCLVVGVNMRGTASACESMARASLTSPRGACHTFDNRADGYARGEACVSMGVGTVADEHNRVERSVVRQDGESASLTAPSALAQSSLLLLAWGGAVPDCHEAHGTGTALGDPIEVSALANAWRGWPQGLLGSAKATVGHAEPAAGSVGLTKMLLMLRIHTSMPNAQLRTMNPHVRSVGLQAAFCANATRGLMVRGGLSSFGFCGTIAHVALVRIDSVEREGHGDVRDVRDGRITQGDAAALCGIHTHTLFCRLVL